MGARIRWREERGAWYLYVYANGTEAKQRLGPTSADKRRGERLAREIRSELSKGKLGLKRREKALPFDEFAAEWLRVKVQLPLQKGIEGHVAPKTAAMREQMIRLHLKPFLGRRDIKGLTVADVDSLSVHYIETGSPPSRRSQEIALGTLRLILANAVAKELIPVNVVDQWKANRPRGRRAVSRKTVDEGRVLEFDERESLLLAIYQQASNYLEFVTFLAESGCRISEAISLRWKDVDLSAGRARIYRHKTGGRPDDVELSQRVIDVLAPIAPDIHPPEVLAFTTSNGAPIRYENFLNRVWNPIVRDLFPDRRVTPHSLRHTWVSLHLSRGTPIEWIRKMGGWSSSKMLLDVYSHYLPQEMSGHADALQPIDRPTPTQVRREE